MYQVKRVLSISYVCNIPSNLHSFNAMAAKLNCTDCRLVNILKHGLEAPTTQVKTQTTLKTALAVLLEHLELFQVSVKMR